MPFRLPLLALSIALVCILSACPDDPPADAGPNEPEATDAGQSEPDANDAGQGEPESNDAGQGEPESDAGTDATDAGADAGVQAPDCTPETCNGNCQAVPAEDGARERCVGEGPVFFNDNCVDGGPPPELQFDDHCCGDADCTESPGGVCADGFDTCGGAPPPQGLNTCRYPECQADTDCSSGGICAPAYFRRSIVQRCIEAACLTDADCTAGAGGRCDFYGTFNPCDLPPVLVCSYASDECGEANGAACTNRGPFQEICYAKQDRTGVECTELPPPPP